MTSTIEYDDAGRPIELTHKTATTTLAQYLHALDNVGNRRVVTETLLSPSDIPIGTFLEDGGQVVMEAEHFVGQRTSSMTQTWLTQSSQPGYTGTSYLQALPDIDIPLFVQTSNITDSPTASYPIQFTNPGTYTVWSRANAPNAAGDSFYVGLNGQLVSVTGTDPDAWSWANEQIPSGDPATLSITTSGLYTLTASMREDGLRLDRMLLTTDTTFIPTSFGPDESNRVTVATVIHEAITRTIVYTYDGLHRLTEADYDTQSTNLLLDQDAYFNYRYDSMGNQTAIIETLDSTVVTTYTYNAANQLATARSDDDGITWHYTHDANGNLLRQIPGGATPADGEIRYSYDGADRLVKVELYSGGSYTLLSEAGYNGAGERMSLTTYALGTPQTVTYVMGEGSELLVADDGSTPTLYLYGESQFAEYDGNWRYPLRDSNASVRQSVDESGAVLSARTYKPFGETLQEGGAYQSSFGFLGAQLDRVSGLLYANGRYYDPATGRYLTPNHTFDPLRPGTLNPYAPPQGPWWLLLPLIGVVFAWKGRKGGPWRMLLLVVVIGFGVTLVGCSGEPTPPAPGPETPTEPLPEPPTIPPVDTNTPEPGEPSATPPASTSTPTGTPTQPVSSPTPTLPPTPCPTPSHTPQPSGLPLPPTGWKWQLLALDLPGRLFDITTYNTTVESNYPLSSPEEGVDFPGIDIELNRKVSVSFLEAVKLQGSGYLNLNGDAQFVAYNFGSGEVGAGATYRTTDCPVTATGPCARRLQTGATSASDADRLASGLWIGNDSENPDGGPGTKVYIESLNRQIVVNDTGGKVQKYQIDVYTGFENEPVDFSRHQSTVWRLERE